MGIFVNTLGMDSYEESSRHASLDPTMELSLQNVLESEMNWNATMQAIYLDELAYKAHTGEEKIYSVNEAAGIFESIKNFFKKLWDKIKALFERFVAMFNSFAKSDSAFVNKYSKTLRKLTLKDFRCNVYEFTNLDKNIDSIKANIVEAIAKTTGGQTSDTCENIVKDFIDGNTTEIGKLNASTHDNAVTEFAKALEKSKALDYFRGLTLDTPNSPVSSENYSNKLFKYFRKQKQEPKETKITSVSEYLKEIENTSDVKDKAKENYDTFKDAIENILDTLDTLEDKYSEADTTNDKTPELQLKVTVKAANYLRSALGVAEIWNGAQLKAIKDRNRQAKSVCVKALANGRKNEISTKYESSDIFGDDTDGSFLSRVELL